MPRQFRDHRRRRRLWQRRFLCRGANRRPPGTFHVGAELRTLESTCLEDRLYKVAIFQRKGRQRQPLARHETRIVQRAPQHEPRRRTQIRSHHCRTEPHPLQRNRPAPRKWVQHARNPSFRAFHDRLPKAVQSPAVLAAPPTDATYRLLLGVPLIVLRLDDMPGHPLQYLPPCLVRSHILQQCRQKHRPARRQRTPRRPDVQRGNVPVPHVLLVHGVDGDLAERERPVRDAMCGHRPTHTISQPDCRSRCGRSV